MHSFLLNVFLNHSILIAACIAAIRFKTIAKDFRPFIFLIWLGLLNETVSLVLIYTKGYNTVNSNIYVLIECLLILYQFYSWNILPQRLHFSLLSAGLLVWVLDNLLWHPLTHDNSVFRIFYSFLVIYCSLKQVNNLAENEHFNLIRNPAFLICAAFMLYYSCKAFIETINAFHIHFSPAWYRNVFTILYIADFISNIIYAIALLCIPRKQVFTMQY